MFVPRPLTKILHPSKKSRVIQMQVKHSKLQTKKFYQTNNKSSCLCTNGLKNIAGSME